MNSKRFFVYLVLQLICILNEIRSLNSADSPYYCDSIDLTNANDKSQRRIFMSSINQMALILNKKFIYFDVRVDAGSFVIKQPHYKNFHVQKRNEVIGYAYDFSSNIKLEVYELDRYRRLYDIVENREVRSSDQWLNLVKKKPIQSGSKYSYINGYNQQLDLIYFPNSKNHAFIIRFCYNSLECIDHEDHFDHNVQFIVPQIMNRKKLIAAVNLFGFDSSNDVYVEMKGYEIENKGSILTNNQKKSLILSMYTRVTRRFGPVNLDEIFSCHPVARRDREIKGIYFRKSKKIFYVFINRFYLILKDNPLQNNFDISEENYAKAEKLEFESDDVQFELLNSKWIKHLPEKSYLITSKNNSFELKFRADDRLSVLSKKSEYLVIDNCNQPFVIQGHIYCFEETFYYYLAKLSELHLNYFALGSQAFFYQDLFKDQFDSNDLKDLRFKLISNYMDGLFLMIMVSKSEALTFVMSSDKFNVESMTDKLYTTYKKEEILQIKKTNCLFTMNKENNPKCLTKNKPILSVDKEISNLPPVPLDNQTETNQEKTENTTASTNPNNTEDLEATKEPEKDYLKFKIMMIILILLIISILIYLLCLNKSDRKENLEASPAQPSPKEQLAKDIFLKDQDSAIGKVGLKSDSKTALKTDLKSDSKTALKTDMKSDSKTALKTGSKTALKTGSKTALKTGSKTALKTGELNEAKADASKDSSDLAKSPEESASGSSKQSSEVISTRSDTASNETERLKVDQKDTEAPEWKNEISETSQKSLSLKKKKSDSDL